MDLFADNKGVWRLAASGEPFGIEWGEIASVSGYRLNGITEVYTCIMLDFVYGDFFEFDDTMTGFSQVIGGITQHLPGISRDWFEQVTRLSINDNPLTVWTASGT